MCYTVGMSKKVPTKFVGLHSHSTFSIGDGIGTPGDHIDFALENEMDALALTDHGNMNGYSHQFFHNQKLRKKGINFRALPGVEAYYIDSLSRWREIYNERQKEKEEARAAKKSVAADEDLTSGGTVVEDENKSKNEKFKDPLNQRNHLVLLPKNEEGLRALFEMISLSYEEGFYRYPRIDLDMLKKYSKGNIVATTACIAGTPGRKVFDHQGDFVFEDLAPNDTNFEAIQEDLKHLIHGFQDALGEENFYLEMQFNRLGAQHLINQHLIEAAKRTSAQLVVTCDAHYSRPEHWREREIYKMMAWSSKGKEMDKDALPKAIAELKCELYPKNAQQVWDSYKETTEGQGWDFYDDQTVLEAIERTHDIAHNQIEDIDPDRSVKLPALHRIVGLGTLERLFKEFGEGSTEETVSFKHLKKLAIEGLVMRKRHQEQEYIDRLKHELEVVRDLKFSKYFLTYAKIMEVAGKHMLIGNARGSAGGSLLAYVLNITQMDPIKHGLLFERFLTKYKKGFPDIDSDFGDRDKAVKLLSDTFGEQNVIPVTNFNQLQLRSLIKDVCRLEGIPFDKANSYTKAIENEARNEAKKQPGFDAAQWVLTFEEAEEKSPTFRKLMEEYPDFETTIKVLFKQMRNVSRHAGGVIITDDTFKNMPVIKSGGVLQTPWPEGLNFRHLESFGMLKFDVLGLGTLRMFEDCIRRILKKEGHKYVSFDMVNNFFYEKLHPDNNPMDDINVYKHVYWNGNFAGIFQFVQPPAQKFIKNMKPRSILDIATATSIFRPGPLGLKVDRKYLKNRRDPKGIRYKHPMLDEVLGDTYGQIVFQEQLQLIFHKLAGVPLDKTDTVRKSFTKKDISNKEEAAKVRKELANEFADLCEEANGIDRKTSYAIFEDMEKLLAYSFNKSHAMAYAITSYQCAWFMTYYPDEWICTYIDYCTTEKGKVAGKEDPKAVALGEALGLGYTIGKPDINLSERDFTVKDKVLIPSFASLKHCGKTVVEEIFRHRPYQSIEDLLFSDKDTWRHSKFNKRAMTTLIKIGAFDSMDLVGEEEHHLFKNYRQMYEVLVERSDELKRACARKKNRNHRELLQEMINEVQEMEDWTLAEKVADSVKLTGSVDINLIVTPDVRKFFKEEGIDSIDDWCDKSYYTWAVVQSAKVATTKTGKKYLRARVYGETGGTTNCFMWSFKEGKDVVIPDNTLVFAKFDKSDFGISCWFGGVEVLVQKS